MKLSLNLNGSENVGNLRKTIIERISQAALSTEYSDGDLPDYLSHYTSLKSCLSILRSDELWLSQAQWMNDPREISFGLDVIEAMAIDCGATLTAEILSKYKKRHLDSDSLHFHNSIYVLSLSEAKDTLSLWLRYGDNGYGASINFIRSKIIQNLQKPDIDSNFIFCPVRYFVSSNCRGSVSFDDFEKPIILAFKDIEKLLESIDSEKRHELESTVFFEAIRLALFIKHVGYKDEKEWRLAIISSLGSDAVDITSSSNSLRPFFKFRFWEKSLFEILDGMTIGPRYFDDNRPGSALEIAAWKYQKVRERIGISEHMIRD